MFSNSGPEVTISGSESPYLVDAPVALSCDIAPPTAVPTIYSWTKDNEPLDGEIARTLVFSFASSSVGAYKCSATVADEIFESEPVSLAEGKKCKK